MAELTLEQILTSIKRRQPLPPEIRQDIIEGASKVGSFLWEGTGPGIAMDVAKMRMENPGLPLSDIFPAVVGAGILRGKGKFRPRVIKGGFSELDDAAKFKATVKRQARKEENLEDIFGARKEKSEAHEILENAREIHKASKARLDKIFDESYKKQRSRLKEGISGLPKKEQDRILKAVDEGRIGEIRAEYSVGWNPIKQTPVPKPLTTGDAIKRVKSMRPAERRTFLQGVYARIEVDKAGMRGILDSFADKPLTSKGLTLQKGGLLSDGYIFNTTGQRVGKVSVSGNDITLRTFTKADAHGQQNIKKKIGTFRTMEDIIDKLEKMSL